MRPCTTQHNKSVKSAFGIKLAKGAKGAECAMGAWGTGGGHGGSCGGSGQWDRIGQFSGQRSITRIVGATHAFGYFLTVVTSSRLPELAFTRLLFLDVAMQQTHS